VPLFNALRSSGPKVLAVILLAPLALAAAAQLAYAVLYASHLNGFPPSWLEERFFYFDSEVLAKAVAYPSAWLLHRDVLIEATKWLACFGIAVWLTIAQIAASRRRTRV
jgi:hypothetical protein